jgi:hypothetical protein
MDWLRLNRRLRIRLHLRGGGRARILNIHLNWRNVDDPPWQRTVDVSGRAVVAVVARGVICRSAVMVVPSPIRIIPARLVGQSAEEKPSPRTDANAFGRPATAVVPDDPANQSAKSSPSDRFIRKQLRPGGHNHQHGKDCNHTFLHACQLANWTFAFQDYSARTASWLCYLTAADRIPGGSASASQAGNVQNVQAWRASQGKPVPGLPILP